MDIYLTTQDLEVLESNRNTFKSKTTNNIDAAIMESMKTKKDYFVSENGLLTPIEGGYIPFVKDNNGWILISKRLGFFLFDGGRIKK